MNCLATRFVIQYEMWIKYDKK